MSLLHVDTKGLQIVLSRETSLPIRPHEETRLYAMIFARLITVATVDPIVIFGNVFDSTACSQVTKVRFHHGFA